MISLQASGGDGNEIYWFINGFSLGKTRAGEKLFWEIEEGEWNIACSDTRGKGDRVRITVK
jgi:membrane carboxypeptidase/penicillin-binding protein PbpC